MTPKDTKKKLDELLGTKGSAAVSKHLGEQHNVIAEEMDAVLDKHSKNVSAWIAEYTKEMGDQQQAQLVIALVRQDFLCELVCTLLTSAALNQALVPCNISEYASHCITHYEAALTTAAEEGRAAFQAELMDKLLSKLIPSTPHKHSN